MRPPAASAFRLGLLFPFLVSVPSYAAEVRVTLPLEGYYRPGRYMPVRVEVREASDGAVVRLTGDGVLPTEVATLNGRADGVAPVLVLREGVRQLGWSLGEDAGTVETTLRPLEGQRLVGFTASPELDVARSIFPDESINTVRLNPVEIALDGASVWQGLDAVVVDQGELTDAGAASLASAGVVVARSAPQPVVPLGWERVGSYDVLRPALLGPSRAGVAPWAFAPVQGWRAELPQEFRTRVLLLGVLMAISILGVSLLRGRRALVLIVLIAVVVTWWLHWWWRDMSPVLSRAGAVWVVNDGSRRWQSDTWAYRAAVRRVEAEQPWVTMTWPVFEREEDVAAMRMRLSCTAQGRPSGFHYWLARGQTIGWVQRAVLLDAPVESVAPVAGASPIDLLMERMYLEPGYLRAGIVPEQSSPSVLTEIYPTTVIRRGSLTTTTDAEPRIAR